MPMPTFRPPHHHVFKLSGIPSCCFFVLLLQNLLTSAQNAPNPSIASLIGGEANSSSSSGTPIAPGWLEEPIPLLLCAAPGTQQAGQVWVLAVEREAATTCSFQVVFSYPVQLSQVVLDVSAGSWEVEVLTGSAVGRLESQQKLSSTDMVPSSPGHNPAQAWANLTITASGPCIRHLLIRLTSTVAPTNLAQWPLKPRLLRLHTSPQPASCNRPQGSGAISAAIRADDPSALTFPVLFPPEVYTPPAPQQPPSAAAQPQPQAPPPPAGGLISSSVTGDARVDEANSPKSQALRILLPTLCTIFGLAALACFARVTYNCGLQRRLHQEQLQQQADSASAARGMPGQFGGGVMGGGSPGAMLGSGGPKTGAKYAAAQRVPSTIPEEEDADCEAPAVPLAETQPWLGQPPPPNLIQAAAPNMGSTSAQASQPFAPVAGTAGASSAMPGSVAYPTVLATTTSSIGGTGEAMPVGPGPPPLGLLGQQSLYPPAASRARRKCRTIASDHTWLPLRPGSGPLAMTRYAAPESSASTSTNVPVASVFPAAPPLPGTPSVVPAASMSHAPAAQQPHASAPHVHGKLFPWSWAGHSTSSKMERSSSRGERSSAGSSGHGSSGMLVLEGSSMLAAHGLELPELQIVRPISTRACAGQTVSVFEGVWRGKAAAVVQMPLKEPRMESTGHAVVMARVAAMHVLMTDPGLSGHFNLVPVYCCQVQQLAATGAPVTVWCEPWACPALGRVVRAEAWRWELQVAVAWCPAGSLHAALVAGWSAGQQLQEGGAQMLQEAHGQEGVREGVWDGSLHALLLTALDMAAGLQALHAHGLVHTELCLARVMLHPCALDVRGWCARLVCRGLAVRLPDSTDVLPGVYHGEATHQAPEVRSHGRVSPASDVYALGCVLYELLTGAPLSQQQPLLSQPQASLSQPPAFTPPSPDPRPVLQDPRALMVPQAPDQVTAAVSSVQTPAGPAASAVPLGSGISSGSTTTTGQSPKDLPPATAAVAPGALPPVMPGVPAALVNATVSVPPPTTPPAPPPPPPLRKLSGKKLRVPQKPWLPRFPPGAPPRLVALISTCISGNPYTRPSAADVTAALKRMLEEEMGAGSGAS